VRDERRDKEKDNAERLRAQRFRREDGDAGRGWKPMFTVYVTATSDNLSRYSLYSNDSNGVRMGPKLLRGMGMDGNFVRENCAGVGSARVRSFRGERSQNPHSEHCRVSRHSAEEHGERPTLSTTKPERVGHPDRKRLSQNRIGELRVSHPPGCAPDLARSLTAAASKPAAGRLEAIDAQICDEIAVMQGVMISDLRQDEHLVCLEAEEVRRVIEVSIGESGVHAIVIVERTFEVGHELGLRALRGRRGGGRFPLSV